MYIFDQVDVALKYIFKIQKYNQICNAQYIDITNIYEKYIDIFRSIDRKINFGDPTASESLRSRKKTFLRLLHKFGSNIQRIF